MNKFTSFIIKYQYCKVVVDKRKFLNENLHEKLTNLFHLIITSSLINNII